MAEAFRQDGFRFVIYSNDHGPPHVHVFNSEGEVLIYLGNENELPTFRENRRMRTRDAIRAIRICHDRRSELWDLWEMIHG